MQPAKFSISNCALCTDKSIPFCDLLQNTDILLKGCSIFKSEMHLYYDGRYKGGEKILDRLTKTKLVAASVKGDTNEFPMLYGEIYKQLYYYGAYSKAKSFRTL